MPISQVKTESIHFTRKLMQIDANNQQIRPDQIQENQPVI